MLFFARINAGVLCSFLCFPIYSTAAENSYHEGDSINLDNVYIYTSLYNQHFSPDPEHNDDQNMLGIEFRMTNKWLYGFSLFDNSFGQGSELLYAGYIWKLSEPDMFRSGRHYLKLIGGLLHGYKGKYKDKIPFNGLGVAPAILPGYGYQYKNYTVEATLGGVSIILFTVGYAF